MKKFLNDSEMLMLQPLLTTCSVLHIECNKNNNAKYNFSIIKVVFVVAIKQTYNFVTKRGNRNR